MVASNGTASLGNGDNDVPTYTILEADGQYPDNTLEETIFAPQEGQNYRVRFLRTALAPVGVDYLKPYSEIPKEIRDEVDGLMV
jgi:C-terminal binding protein